MLYKGASDKVGSVELVTVTILAAAATASTSADPALVGGKIIGVYPTSANASDAFLETVTNSATGVVTVTTSTNQTAEVEYQVAILRATGNDA